LEITRLYDGYCADLDVLNNAGLFPPSVQELWTYALTIDPPSGLLILEITLRYPALASIRRLEFQGNTWGVRVPVVHIMLASMPRLEVLGLSWHCNNSEGELWDAIAQCKATLRELRIDNMSLQHWQQLQETEMQGLHSLEGFSRLEILKIGAGMLWALWSAWRREYPGQEIDGFLEGMFPRDIRELTFWEPSKEFKAGLCRLAGAVALGRYPRLGSVVIARPEIVMSTTSWDGKMDWFWEEARAELQDAFEAAEVRFVMDISPRTRPTERSATSHFPF
jgi:hypothetical protein